MKKTKVIICTMLSAVVITGCTKTPPKCSDEETLTLIQQIISDKIQGSSIASDTEVKSNIKINLPRATAFDKNINKYSCEAKLAIAGELEIPMIYESQLDDNGQHIVSIGGFPAGYFLVIQKTIYDAVKKAKNETMDSNVKNIIEKMESLNDLCRGGSGDDPKTEKACEERDSVLKELESAGWCWGPDSAIGADKKWVKCE